MFNAQDKEQRLIVKCTLCESLEYSQILSKKKCMASDCTLWPLPLNKIRCDICGLIRNKYYIPDSVMNVHYKTNYMVANPTYNDEPTFFQNDGTHIKRSKAIFDWIHNSLMEVNVQFNKVIEIGCSNGLVLEKFRDKYPDKNICGIEPNEYAANSCRQRKLNVLNSFLEDLGEEGFDLIYSVAVLEHVEDTNSFFSKIYAKLSDNGVLVVMLPSQNLCSYDVYFGDHIHQFTTKHIELFGKKHGFHQIYCGYNKLLAPFSIHVFRKISALSNITYEDYKQCREVKMYDSIDFYENKIASINKFISDQGSIAIYGCGEKFNFLNINSSLQGKQLIFFDDNFDRFAADVEKKPNKFSAEYLHKHKGLKWILFFNPNEVKCKLLNDYNVTYEIF